MLFLVTVATLALVTAQCPNNRRVEFYEDNQRVTGTPPTVTRTVGDSFVLRCERCDTTKGRPNFTLNGIRVLPCGMSHSSVCTSSRDNISRSLHFSSITTSQSGKYRCTNRRITVNVTPGQLSGVTDMHPK